MRRWRLVGIVTLLVLISGNSALQAQVQVPTRRKLPVIQRAAVPGVPAIASFTPTSARFGEQTEIIVTGTNLDRVTAVHVGTEPQATLLAATPTILRIRKAATSNGGPILVWFKSATDSSPQTVRSTASFVVILPPPVISTVSPKPNASGGVVDVAGEYLYYASRAEVGGKEVQIWMRAPGAAMGGTAPLDILTIVLPSGLTAGHSYDVKVTSSGGTATKPGAWTQP